MKTTAAVFSCLFLVLTACASKKSPTTTAPGPAAAPASAPAAPAGNMVHCTNNKDVRTLEIKTQASGCELFYTKFGTEKSVAAGSGESKHCAEVRDKISANLTRAGFKCE